MPFVDASRRIRRAPLLEEQRWLWNALRPPYRRLLAALSNARGVDRAVNGQVFRWRYPYSEFDRSFEQPILRVFQERVAPGSTVLDVGASFGLYSVVGGRCVGEQGRVFSFEPSRMASVLADHLRLNGVAGRVEILRVVVSDEVGVVDFWEGDDTSLASIARAPAERGVEVGHEITRHICPATTLDAFCHSRKIAPDVVKIDVEGAELKALRGAETLLRGRRGSILLEVHPWAMGEFGDTQDAMWSWLDSFGWTATHLYSRGSSTNPDATLHFLCEPRSA
jgi:FkbM family methyltransferase